MLNLRWLRWASLTEGTTLVLLVCIAVPLKRLMGLPELVPVLGPLHGAAFLFYVAMVAHTNAKGLLTSRESFGLMLVAFIPFGAFFMGGMFKRKASALVLARANTTFSGPPMRSEPTRTFFKHKP